MQRLIAVILLSCTALCSIGQQSMFQRLSATPDLRLTLTTDWDSLHNKKDDSYQDAILEINGDTWNVEVKPRGVSRLKYCAFPPFLINFKKKHLRADSLIGVFDKIKVVTHCLDTDEGEINQFEEKLIYDIYGILTDESFKVTHAEVTYKYPDDTQPAMTARILLLEPNDELASRLQGSEIKRYNVSPDSLNARNYNRMALFQFMIGNFDWDYGIQRNVRMIQATDHYLLVPYDFDYSAIVYPTYARLNKDYGLKDFRDRIYLGKHFFEQLESSKREYLTHKKEILDYVSSYPYLKKSRCREIAAYLRKFFNLLANNKKEIVQGYILRHH